MALFSDDEVAAMERMLETKRPRPPDSDESKLEDVVSLTAVGTDAGLAVRIRLQDGSERQLRLNPVAARHLALSVLYRGEEAGWLDAYGDVISGDAVPAPPPPSED